MLGTARTVVESDTQGTVTMEHTESPRTQVVNQPTLTVRAMKPSSASLTAAIARPPSAHLASPAASSKQIPADFVFCFVAVHRAQCPTRWGRPTKEIKNATDTQKRRKRQGRRAGEMLHRQCRGMQLSTCLQVQPGLAAMRVMQMMFGTCNLGAREVD